MIEVRGAGFAYGGGGRALDGVSLSVAPGERVVLLGLNGSGKSTLGRLVNGGLRSTSGVVSVDGEKDPRAMARLVGFVRQDPRNQIVSALVEDEVAFGPRNLGLERREVASRVDGALGSCGILALRGRLTTELSGGQQQLLALAGVMAMRPRYLVLDEVCAHLDDAARERVRTVVRTAVADGMGVLEIAHSPEELFGATRVVMLGDGHVRYEGSSEGLLTRNDLLEELGWDGDEVVKALVATVRSGQALGPIPDVTALAACASAGEKTASPRRPSASEHLLSARDLRTAGRDGQPVLNGVALDVPTGVTLVLGATGSGKTTTARALAGVLRADSGEALLDGTPVRPGRVGLSFQRPEDQLFCDTVLDDVAYGPRQLGAGEDAALAAAREAARRLGIPRELLGRSPFELSGGQMRRVALAGVVAPAPAAYVFDEPTAGLDAPARRQLRTLVGALAEEGAAVVVVTHDAPEWLDVANDVVFLSQGRVVARESAERAGGDPGLFCSAGLAAPLAVRLRAAREAMRRA